MLIIEIRVFHDGWRNVQAGDTFYALGQKINVEQSKWSAMNIKEHVYQRMQSTFVFADRWSCLVNDREKIRVFNDTTGRGLNSPTVWYCSQMAILPIVYLNSGSISWHFTIDKFEIRVQINKCLITLLKV